MQKVRSSTLLVSTTLVFLLYGNPLIPVKPRYPHGRDLINLDQQEGQNHMLGKIARVRNQPPKRCRVRIPTWAPDSFNHMGGEELGVRKADPLSAKYPLWGEPPQLSTTSSEISARNNRSLGASL